MACILGLLRLSNGLLWGIVAHVLGYLAFQVRYNNPTVSQCQGPESKRKHRLRSALGDSKTAVVARFSKDHIKILRTMVSGIPLVLGLRPCRTAMFVWSLPPPKERSPRGSEAKGNRRPRLKLSGVAASYALEER